MPAYQKRLPSVLIIEDEPEITELLRTVMESRYQVVSAGDVPGALAYLDRRPPSDLILLDCLLPGGTCGQVLDKASPLGCALVLMSGSPEVLQAFEACGYPLLQKPFKIGQLFDAIEIALSRRRG